MVGGRIGGGWLIGLPGLPRGWGHWLWLVSRWRQLLGSGRLEIGWLVSRGGLVWRWLIWGGSRFGGVF